MRVNVLVFILFLLFFRVLCVRYDMISEAPHSWISDDNFAEIVRLSFPFAICCNIYLSDLLAGVEVLFNQFRRIYPYQYLLKRRNHECQGYFLLGANEMEIINALKKVPSSISTTEILVILDTEISSDSLILNTSIYEIANVNVVSMSGIWSLSENYIDPRVFHKVDRFDDMIHHYDVYDLRGRELQICSFFCPPVTYLKSTTNRTINGVEAEVFLANDATEVDGIEMKLFLLLADKLNFTWTIRKPIGPYRYGRRINDTEWNGGIITMLHKRKVDMAFASIWMTIDQSNFINMTEHWYQLYIHFLVPRPQRTTSFWALTKPFTLKAWLLLIATLLLKSLYMYARAWIDPKFPKRFRNFLTTVTELTGRLLGSIMTKSVTHIKLQMLLWQTAGWLIIAAYSSSLAVRLAGSGYETRIDTIQQFLEANLTWGSRGQIPAFHNYFDLTDPFYKQLPKKHVQLKSDEDVQELIAKGKYAIFGKLIGTSFFPDDYVSNDDLRRYRLMREDVGRFYSVFGVQSWLLRPINRIMLLLKQSGIVTLHVRDVLRRRTTINLREVMIEQDGFDGSIKVLSLRPLGAGFALLLLGLSISTFVFCMELRHARKNKSVRQVLREIERKRRIRDLRSTKAMIKSFSGRRLNVNTLNLAQLQ